MTIIEYLPAIEKYGFGVILFGLFIYYFLDRIKQEKLSNRKRDDNDNKWLEMFGGVKQQQEQNILIQKEMVEIINKNSGIISKNNEIMEYTMKVIDENNRIIKELRICGKDKDE